MTNEDFARLNCGCHQCGGTETRRCIREECVLHLEQAEREFTEGAPLLRAIAGALRIMEE